MLISVDKHQTVTCCDYLNHLFILIEFILTQCSISVDFWWRTILNVKLQFSCIFLSLCEQLVDLFDKQLPIIEWNKSDFKWCVNFLWTGVGIDFFFQNIVLWGVRLFQTFTWTPLKVVIFKADHINRFWIPGETSYDSQRMCTLTTSYYAL